MRDRDIPVAVLIQYMWRTDLNFSRAMLSAGMGLSMSMLFDIIWNNRVLTGAGVILTLSLTLILLVPNMDKNRCDIDSELMGKLMGDQDVHK